MTWSSACGVAFRNVASPVEQVAPAGSGSVQEQLLGALLSCSFYRTTTRSESEARKPSNYEYRLVRLQSIPIHRKHPICPLRWKATAAVPTVAT